MPLSRRRNAVLTIAALLIIVGGVQALLYQRDTAGEKAAEASRQAADRAYAQCLEAWGNDLVSSLEAVQAARMELDRAEARKNRLLDELIVVSNQAQASGATSQEDLPPALVAHYEHVLKARVDAQRDYETERAQLAEARAKNELVAPRVKCRR